MGVIPRAATAIFDELDDEKFVDKRITVSYLEIYNEELVCAAYRAVACSHIIFAKMLMLFAWCVTRCATE